jgi:hypothetical protein
MFSSVSTGLSRFEKGNHAISAFAGKSASAARDWRGQVVHFALQDAQGLATWVAHSAGAGVSFSIRERCCRIIRLSHLLVGD